jgi:hypothetical protein
MGMLNMKGLQHFLRRDKRTVEISSVVKNVPEKFHKAAKR